ncbi:biorientation of chromosomes in cell division protein 1-like 1 isoform X2 [Emydura macquarii macquarii]|uniref:biorientation of chromosomes in cell division protein 1-like 1 isoform X2 n=1 Tax=Emydura macquarii macquarii TaxID=1129001 RepID=UPI00352AD1DD
MASNPQPQPPPPPPPPPPPQQQPPLPGAAGGGGAVEPELVSVIVNHLKSQGLFDQFRRDCLADVDTKPAYQNLRQRVDNFVSNHLATHTWSPHLNKNQLRNNIRQQVLKSGMLESGIDRIISQVVDPKINHTFRPQVEKAVHEFLATFNHKEEASPSSAPSEEKADVSVTVQGVSTTAPSATVASDALSILETITSLNQEASAARASTENTNSKNSERTSKRLSSQQSVDGTTERERNSEDLSDQEKPICDSSEGSETVAKCEDLNELLCPSEEIKNVTKDVNNLIHPSKEILQENDDLKSKLTDKGDRKPESTEKGERKKEKKDKNDKKFDHSKKTDDVQKAKEEKQVKEREAESVKQWAPEKNNSKHKITEGAKEEHTLEDSDVDVLSDITVSSVHTSDLSSFEEESEEEAVVSDSTEEGEITSDDEEERNNQSKTKPQTNDISDGKAKPVRHAYVHKPFLYSKYYSDSDDERTVEQRRQSIAREKEERLLRRQINRERLEEKRKQKAAEKTKSLKSGNQEGKSGLNLEESSTKSFELKVTGTSMKDVLKEQKFLEKKVALSRKRKRDSRHVEDSWKKKYEYPEEDSKETQKTNETCEKMFSKELKHNHGKSEVTKPVRRVSESVHLVEESKNDPKVEREHKRKTSTSLQIEGTQQDTETRDLKKQLDRAEISTDELQKQKCVFKNEKHLKKDDTEIQNLRSIPKKEVKSYKDKNEKERTLSEDKLLVKHKYKGDSVHKASDDTDPHSFEKSLKGEDSVQKNNQPTKVPSDDKFERKSKHRSERKLSTTSKDGKSVSEHTLKNEEILRKENNKKDRHISTEKSKAEYKSKRSSSDSRPQKDFQGTSKQLVSSSQRKSESHSEDKHEVESANSDSNLRQEDSIHKDRRRSKSFLEDKFLLKSKSKSHSKQSKAIETELQESFTKHETGQKSDKDKNMEENETDKQRKSKNEDKDFEENIVDFELDSGRHSTYSSQKDSSHRFKLQAGEKVAVKEKYKSDKDLSYSKLERKLSVEGHKSRNLKHSNKEMKKKEESNKLEDKDIKEMDGSHEKVQGAMIIDKKSSKKLSCENRKGSLSVHEMTMEEEKLATDVFVTSHILVSQRPTRTSDDSLHSEQEEPMEVDTEQTYANMHTCKIEEKSSSNSLQDMDFENTAKENMYLHSSKNELRNRLVDFKAHVSEFTAPADRNSEQTIEHEKILTKGVNAVDIMSKQASEEQGPIKQGAFQMNIVYETSGRILLNAPVEEQTSEDARKPNSIVNPIEESVSLASHSSRQDASHKKSMDTYFSDFTDTLPTVAKEESHTLDKICLNKDSVILGNTATETAYLEQHGSPVLDCVMKEGEITTRDTVEKDGETQLIGEQAAGENLGDISIQEGYDQVTVLDSVQGRSEYKVTDGIEGKSLMTDQAADHGGVSTKKSVLMNLEKKERDDNLNTGPTVKEERRIMVDVVKKSEIHDMGATVESSLALVPMNVIGVPEEITKDSFIVSGAEDSDGIIADTEDKNESNAVGTSAGSGDHMLYNRLETIEASAIGTSTEKMIEGIVMATSTGEGKGKGTAIHSEKESDATTTFSEEESEVTLVCTSIEADEGFTTNIWAKSNKGVSFSTEAVGECTVAAAEESGGVVTEGFAETESFLTSTKEGESSECTMIYTEENGKDLVNTGRIEIEDNVNSAGTEEKDDAVTSAGSEEKCKTSTCGHTCKFEGSVTCIGEVESDGAVTSAGIEAGEGSMSSNNSDDFQSNIIRAGQLKESEGAVTCTGAEERGHSFIICSVTGADVQEESAVTGACVEMVMDNNAVTGTSADKGEDTVNGESAVTSTGITAEDDAENAAVCTGLEDSNEGFAVCLDVEKYESAMDSTGAKEEATITMINIGPCDDEGFVTSTGAKEEDEEGEGIVTSTGRGNEEIEHASTCTGIDESALVCIGAEGENSIICIVAEQVEAESDMAASNIDKGEVDSNTGAKKETNVGIICKSAKGIVESSVTSASVADEGTVIPNTEKDEVALISIDVEEYEGPMTSAMTEKGKGQFAAEEKDDNIACGSHGRECEGPITSAITKEDESPPASTDKEEKAKGDVISTSSVEEGDAPIPCLATEVEEGSLTAARTYENGVSTKVFIDNEEFEAPMPSTATEFKENTHTASSQQAKDECTVISTSIVEEFEAPMSSAAMEYDRTEEVNENAMFCIDMEIYEVPMASASNAGDDENHPTASSKEEKDECTMISTSIMEEQVILMSSEAAEDRIQHVAAGTEAKSDTAMISTSMEYFETPMPSATTQDEGKLTASGSEGRQEVAMITRHMKEECEIVLISAATQAESQLIAAEIEEKDEGSIISPNAADDCKVVETSAARDEQCVLTALNPEGKSGGSMIFVRKVVECGTPTLRVASSNEDQHIASSMEDKEEGAVITVSTMEECDSLFTFAVIEESQLIAANTEVKDENDVIFNSTKEIECILSSTGPEKSDNSVHVGGREGDESKYRGEKEIHEDAVMGESIVAKTTVGIEAAETAETTVNPMSVGEALCVEISTDSTAIVSPSTEMGAGNERAEEYIQYVEVTSEPFIPSEEAKRNDDCKNIDYKVNTSLLLENDFSETRTSPAGAQTLPLVTERESKLTVNTNQDEITVEAKLGEKNDFPVSHMDKQFENDGKRNTVEVDDDRGIEVSFQQKTDFNSGNEDTLPNLAEELELKTNLKTEEPQKSRSPTREEPHEEPHIEEYPKDLPLKNALKKDSIDVENSDTQRVEEFSCKERTSKSSVTTDKETAQETSNTMDMTEAEKIQIEVKAQEIEIPNQEKVSSMPRMEKNKSPTREDDYPITQDLRKGNRQSQCSRIKDVKEVTSEDIAEISKEIIRKHTPLSNVVEEKDDFTSKQDTCEKAKQSLESKLSSVEENQPVIVKRKRGRPRKYPLEAVQSRVDSDVDINIGNVQESPTLAGRGKISQTAKDTSNNEETANEDEAGKAEMIVRRRGRKPRCSLIPSEEVETLEPERKRRKLASAAEEEMQEQEEEEEDDDDDETHSRATTRSATRLEAQRKQPSKPATRAASKGNSPSSVSPRKHQNLAAKKRSPSEAKVSKSPPLVQLKMQPSKRKREASPPVVRRKGQLKVDETPLKKTKR